MCSRSRFSIRRVSAPIWLISSHTTPGTSRSSTTPYARTFPPPAARTESVCSPSSAVITCQRSSSAGAAVSSSTGSWSSRRSRSLPPFGWPAYHTSKRDALRPAGPLSAVESRISAPPADSKVVPPSP